MNERTEQIRVFLDTVSQRLTPRRYEDVDHYLRQEEWELAVWMLAEYLDEEDSSLNESEWTTFSELATSVRLDPLRFSWLRAESS